ncbi:Alpha-L-arabinofuranosidase 1 [Capsicum baccatum]|uniref:non-reducing end alpha-L-arabinofuranosidase n=1 Tax=Capsicum baccatum TaxID=33114 RepID=A0A2G2UWW6_CAPBA|nr:Alpha-L-arabinofuranosidase 1 [Capsicum baccatum]
MWFDQVSLMPLDTCNGNGFWKDLFGMLQDLKPAFLRFPGGCYVEGVKLKNAFRWKETVRPWEERPGHFNDRWSYWTDDGLGHFEFLQLAVDLGALPVWVFNSGISHEEQVNTSNISPFVQDTLDGIEFSRGAFNSTWGSVRAAMGHPEPFDLRYVAVGNEILTVPCEILSHFDDAPRSGPKAFISEYATKGDAGNGNLLAALAEAGFLIGVERTGMLWTPPNAIVFTSSQVYGIPSYWMQHLFEESNGATLLNSTLQANPSNPLIASAITWQNETDNDKYLRMKVVNIGNSTVTLSIDLSGLDSSLQSSGATKTILTSSDVMDENSFADPKKIAPVKTMLDKVCESMDVVLLPYSITSTDLLRLWTPDAIVFTSSQVYGTPSYWMQHFFKESNGATLIDSTLQDNNLSNSLIASSIKWRNETDDNDYIRIKVVNFGNNTVTLNISISGLENSLQPSGATKTILTSSNVMDENAFTCPKKIIPVETMLDKVGENMDVVLLPYSITSIDLLTKSISI